MPGVCLRAVEDDDLPLFFEWQADEEDGAVAGNVVSWTGDDGRMVGYWIGKAHWGRGIASSALHLFLDVERHRPLLATVAEHNVGSCRVLEKAGFQLVTRKLVDDGPEPGTFAELRFRLG